MEEKLIYEEGRIRITANTFNNGRGETFIIPTIKGIRDIHHGKPVAVLLLGMAVLAVAYVHSWFAHSREILSGLGGVLVIIYLMQKEKYRILIVTPAGEVEAFATKDETRHKNILTCLKRAVSIHT
jgi:hypothetical protein